MVFKIYLNKPNSVESFVLNIKLMIVLLRDRYLLFITTPIVVPQASAALMLRAARY